MSAIMNGVALHGSYRPFGGTFLTFSDYARNAIRMWALMKLPVVCVFTHDAIGLGEDGPTHEPVEHPSMLALDPEHRGLAPGRCDRNRRDMAASLAARRRPELPAALSRQALPHAGDGRERIAAIGRGAYVLRQPAGKCVALLATGSEVGGGVGVALAATSLLAEAGVAARVVSMPCLERFER